MNPSTYRILIIGAGGFGREILAWLRSYPASIQISQEEWSFGGFLDDNPNALDSYDIEGAVIGKPLDFDYQASDRLICAIADPEAKLKICRQIQANNGQFINMICDTKTLERQNKLGIGIIMVPGATITSHVALGNFVTLNVYATVGHDAVVGDGCTLNGHTDVTGGVILHEGVFMGTHASVIPSIEVGAYARIGAGSVVVQNVPPYTTVMGVPAKKLFTNTPNANDSNMQKSV
ncbi:transferase [bacterium]|nr:transferase [bacterium]